MPIQDVLKVYIVPIQDVLNHQLCGFLLLPRLLDLSLFIVITKIKWEDIRLGRYKPPRTVMFNIN